VWDEWWTDRTFSHFFSFLLSAPEKTQWRSWLRHYATNRKVAVSIHDGGSRNFSLTYSFRTHHGPAVDSAYNRNEFHFLGGGWADNLTTFMCLFSWSLGASNSWNPQALSRPVRVVFYLYLPVPFHHCSTYVTPALFIPSRWLRHKIQEVSFPEKQCGLGIFLRYCLLG
jgi:hypothetical protein